MLKINELAKKYNIDNVSCYGDYLGKVDISNKDKKGNLILVTAISPTKYGEGKTTVAIGLVDAMNKINKSCCGVLREPSLGPVFGLKGGATGGGRSLVVPSDEINLHFTGDFHAITSANNLIAASVDNHIYHGNELGIVKKVFKRCIDMNDRYLRDDFNITAASEIMTVFCLSKDIYDLRDRIGNIIVGYNKDDMPIFARDLKVEGSSAMLLKEAIKPNIVQTLENNLVYVHGGPFANISIGTSSCVSINEGLKNFDYVITEAGFGSDLGAVKFFDIMAKNNDLTPNCVVLVVTNKAIKVNGLENIDAHLNILNSYGVNVVVAINKHSEDTDEEIKYITDYLDEHNVPYSITTSFIDGGCGSIELANKVLENIGNNKLNDIYNIEDSVVDKINKICINLYKAKDVKYMDNALDKISLINKLNLNYPICICKTQYSISDDKNKLGYPKDYTVTVRDIDIMNGSKIIVVKLNDVITMPGMPKSPNYLNIDIDSDSLIY